MSQRKRKPNLQTGARRLTCSIGLMLALSFTLSAIDTSAQEVRKWKIEGIPSTGPNSLCGEPLFELPPGVPSAGFSAFGEFDPRPEAIDAIPLSSANCSTTPQHKDVLLATTAGQAFLDVFGFPPPNPLLKNIPLRDVAVISDFFGVRQPLPPMGAVPPNLFPTKGASDFAITLGVWLKVRTHMEISCFSNGTAKVEAVFRHLIPNGVYTLNFLWNSTTPGIPFMINPVAGFPNVMVASPEGRGRFERVLHFCPKGESAPDGSIVMFSSLFYHSDSSPLGAVPFTPLGVETFRLADGTTFPSTIPPGLRATSRQITPLM